jgi:hypothetical protein
LGGICEKEMESCDDERVNEIVILVLILFLNVPFCEEGYVK